MSHIIFGDFHKENINASIIKELKHKLMLKDILIFINEEIDFYNDIDEMLNENKVVSNNVRYCITSLNQKYNSDDLIFPYDKYSEEELFPNGDERKTFEEICLKNLEVLKNGINSIRTIMQPINLRIFISDGYDDFFQTIKCNQDKMINDIWNQIINSFNLKSKIYEIKGLED